MKIYENKGCLYKLDFPNGKSYIGITKINVRSRFLKHCNTAKHGKDYLLCRAIRKYKYDVIYYPLLYSNNWEYLCYMEKLAISKYNTFGENGYNSTSGGEGTVGYCHTDSAKLKMSIARKSRESVKLSVESRNLISISKLGKKRCPILIKNISEKRKNIPLKANFKKVICLTTGIEYESLNMAASETKSLSSKISAVCHGKRNSTNGLIFKFLK